MQIWLSESRAAPWMRSGSGAPGDRFGWSLAACDFGNGPEADLAIGAPGSDFGGQVNLIYGSPQGLSAAGNQIWSQDSKGVPGNPEPYDYFGYSLAAARFDAGPQADLAIGVPPEDFDHADGAGLVHVLRGSADGLSARGTQLWSQNSSHIAGRSEADEIFGYSLVAGNFGRGSFDDLAVGVAGEAVGSVGGAGAVNVIYGTTAG